MDIKIEDYLDEQEIKEICKDALYQKIREDMRELNVNDIIANISYAEVAAMVDTYVGEDNFCKKEIPQKVHRVIDELSTYTVFRKADAWEKELERAPKWDGHTPSDAIERISTLSVTDLVEVVRCKDCASGERRNDE